MEEGHCDPCYRSARLYSISRVALGEAARHRDPSSGEGLEQLEPPSRVLNLQSVHSSCRGEGEAAEKVFFFLLLDSGASGK